MACSGRAWSVGVQPSPIWLGASDRVEHSRSSCGGEVEPGTWPGALFLGVSDAAGYGCPSCGEPTPEGQKSTLKADFVQALNALLPPGQPASVSKSSSKSDKGLHAVGASEAALPAYAIVRTGSSIGQRGPDASTTVVDSPFCARLSDQIETQRIKLEAAVAAYNECKDGHRNCSDEEVIALWQSIGKEFKTMVSLVADFAQFCLADKDDDS